MRIANIEARDLPEAFYLCCREVLDHGYEYVIGSGSYSGTRRKELDFVNVHILHPGNTPRVPDVPPGVPCPTSNQYINEYLSYLLTEDKQQNEQYTYGEDLSPQIEEVIRRYNQDGPECNQLCMTLGSKKTLWLKDPQCLRVVDTRIRYGKLHFVVYFRSWDLWAGFPTNLGGLQLVKEYIAASVGVGDGEFICCSKGLHLYDHCWEWARQTVGVYEK